MSTLWLVKIDEANWDYDRFVEAAVWAETSEDAERIVREEFWRKDDPDLPDTLWIENPAWRLHVRPAPTEGVALVHWHAG